MQTNFDTIIHKLKQQTFRSPTLAFIDFDGTLYTAGKTMWKSLFYNQKTSRILRDLHIPFILVTGRADWSKMAALELRFFRMKKPDEVITGAATAIYLSIANQLVADA